MKVALIGASGFIGQHILAEATNRKHQVTALVRDTSKVAAHPQVTSKALDVHNAAQVTAALVGHDAAIISLHHNGLDLQALINAVKASGVPRLIVVGGAGSLEVAPGVQVVDTPEFPAEWKPIALAAREFLNLLRAEKVLDWTYLSPSAFIEPGERTGKFRLGKDQLLVNEQGESRISNQDFAIALIDELETPTHSQQRFTVGY
ncbi:MAG: NAD(P)-dependent oxidoreductase [Cellvibrio sp.]|uniref:NAD(P)-dependent oxidoreductase n=1 Tax=Cellvibrio sp. TaxID=1965322 RepID=UPI0031A3BDA2